MAVPFAPAGAVMLAGSDSTGGVVSRTVTVNDAEAVALRLSVALQPTVVVPSGKTAPEPGVHVTGRLPSCASVALAANVTAAPAGPVASTVIGAGTVTTGGVLFTVTVKLPGRAF